ncbi:hypothetical protein Tco_0320146 [Tanacetum coccineum]
MDFEIDYLTDSMNYIPVSLENQANHAGISEETNSAGSSIASEEKDEEVEIIVVPSAVKIPEEKDESRTTSKNSKPEETLTEPQTEMKDSSTNPKIQAFRRELEEIALKHLGNVPENNTTSTNSLNTDTEEEEPDYHREEKVEDDPPRFLSVQGLILLLQQKSIDKGRRYKRRKETKGKKVVSSLDFQEEFDAGAEQVNTASTEQVNTACGVNTGSTKLSTGN